MSRKSSVITTETPEKFQRAVRKAAELLRAGGIVALPTETVYGLAANALDPAAVGRIFEAKGRPAHNPVIVHVADGGMARRSAGEWPEIAERLAGEFWPGPLTLVLKRGEGVPDIVTAGGGTVGIRHPRHPLFEAVIRECGFPLAAPSANVSNRLSPTSAAHVLDQMEGRVPLIVDGGDCEVGIESTVVDVTGGKPAVLRPGMIGEAEVGRVWKTLPLKPDSVEAGKGKRGGDDSVGAPLRSPGQLSRHYAPRAKLLVLGWTDGAGLTAALQAREVDRADACLLTFDPLGAGPDWKRVIHLSDDPAKVAQTLYSSLHDADCAAARWIVVEAPPKGPEWNAIEDRLKRASA
jgi:L-threonylcarbamoyladenylate synthase